jgi:RNA polymerase sigma-70 factor (ECF subfamily)
MGIGAHDLEDLTHEVFMTVHRRLSDYDSNRPLRPWLFGIAYRIATRYRALARHQRETRGDLHEAVDEKPAVDEQLADHQARQLFARALEALDLDQRAIFLMHDVEECSMPEIAEALSIPLNTAYSRLRLARERLKTEVARLRGEK